MLIRRLLIGAIIRAAQNPAVQQKAGKIAGKALDKARPSMLRASRRAGEWQALSRTPSLKAEFFAFTYFTYLLTVPVCLCHARGSLIKPPPSG